LWARREQGLLPPFRRIAIETTGLADPAPVAHALLAEPEARYACRLDGIVTTVDALNGPMQIERYPEARRQVAIADRVLLTKTDLVSDVEVARVTAIIGALNATAQVRRVVNGDVTAEEVFDLSPGAGADDARVVQWLQAFDDDPHHRHRHLPFRHGDEIGSITLRCDRPLEWERLRGWLQSVLSLRGDRVLRLKGLVHLVGHDQPVVLQGVHHVLHPPVFYAKPLQGGTRVVLITRGLSAAGLRESFAISTSPAAQTRSARIGG
jgi:G3E family GTPase